MSSAFRQGFLESESAEALWICQDCLGDYMLKRLVADLIEDRHCVQCGLKRKNALAPRRIADFIRRDLQKHFVIDEGLYPGQELALEHIVGQAIGCKSAALNTAVAALLVKAEADEDDFYFSGQEYRRASSPFESEEHEHWYTVGEWNNIARELTHGRRFFNDKARDFFESLISEALSADDASQPDKRAFITTITVGASFFRARIAHDNAQAAIFVENAGLELGAPPKERASSNRMSPSGIPLLYVSGDAETCIAEVRPSIGDLLVVGRFESTAPLTFFDFTVLSNRLKHAPLSMFDPRNRERSEHRKMLEYLHDEISRPVRSGDTDYVVTQALAEFIRYNKQQVFDGIAFRSVQRNEGVNYVLFDHSGMTARSAPEWRPQFDLKITADSVTIKKLNSVRYATSVQEIRK